MQKLELFKLDKGPWKIITEGIIQELPTRILINPENYILCIVYDVEGKKIKGALAQIYFPFYAEGYIEQATESFPSNIITFSKKENNEIYKFAIICTKPEYFIWKEETFQKGIDHMLDEIQKSKELFKKHMKSFSANIKELKELSEEIKKIFFAEPLLLPLLISKFPRREEIGKEKLVILGKTIGGEIYRENIEFLKCCVVSEGEYESRKKMLRVLAENFLLAEIPVIVFDFKNSFGGIVEPNKNREEIYSFSRDLEALGFPAKIYDAIEEIKISLKEIDENVFLEVFGIKGNEAKIIAEGLKSKEADGLEKLIGIINKMKFEYSNYEIKRAIRILHIINEKYGYLFGKAIDISKMLKLKTKPLARVSIINMQKLKDVISIRLFVLGILNKILENYKGEYSKELRGAILIENFGEILRKKDKLSKNIIKCLKKFNSLGLGLILESENLALLDEEIIGMLDAKINIVKSKPLDIAIRYKVRKPVRILVRPTLSNI